MLHLFTNKRWQTIITSLRIFISDCTSRPKQSRNYETVAYELHVRLSSLTGEMSCELAVAWQWHLRHAYASPKWLWMAHETLNRLTRLGQKSAVIRRSRLTSIGQTEIIQIASTWIDLIIRIFKKISNFLQSARQSCQFKFVCEPFHKWTFVECRRKVQTNKILICLGKLFDNQGHGKRRWNGWESVWIQRQGEGWGDFGEFGAAWHAIQEAHCPWASRAS